MKYSITKKQILSASHNDDGVDIAAGCAARDPSSVKPRLPDVSPDGDGNQLEKDAPEDQSTGKE